jgi:hypothetical protein
MSTSITISITQSCKAGPGRHVQNKILNIHVLLIHVSETYNTIKVIHGYSIFCFVHDAQDQPYKIV